MGASIWIISEAVGDAPYETLEAVSGTEDEAKRYALSISHVGKGCEKPVWEGPYFPNAPTGRNEKRPSTWESHVVFCEKMMAHLVICKAPVTKLKW